MNPKKTLPVKYVAVKMLGQLAACESGRVVPVLGQRGSCSGAVWPLVLGPDIPLITPRASPHDSSTELPALNF